MPTGNPPIALLVGSPRIFRFSSYPLGACLSFSRLPYLSNRSYYLAQGFASYYLCSLVTKKTLAFSLGLLTSRANGLEAETQVDTVIEFLKHIL